MASETRTRARPSPAGGVAAPRHRGERLGLRLAPDDDHQPALGPQRGRPCRAARRAGRSLAGAQPDRAPGLRPPRRLILPHLPGRVRLPAPRRPGARFADAGVRRAAGARRRGAQRGDLRGRPRPGVRQGVQLRARRRARVPGARPHRPLPDRGHPRLAAGRGRLSPLDPGRRQALAQRDDRGGDRPGGCARRRLRRRRPAHPPRGRGRVGTGPPGCGVGPQGMRSWSDCGDSSTGGRDRGRRRTHHRRDPALPRRPPRGLLRRGGGRGPPPRHAFTPTHSLAGRPGAGRIGEVEPRADGLEAGQAPVAPPACGLDPP